MMTSRLQRLREWASLLPLLLLLAATYWLNMQVQAPPQKSDSSKRHDPDFIINNPVITTLDVQGKPHFILTAVKMEHYPDDDTTVLYTPHLTSLYPNRPPINTTAKHGEISHNSKEIFLHHDVKIVRAASSAQSKMTLTSSYLHITPEQNLMDTNRAVTITDAHSVTHAIGMTLNNKTRIISLLAQVRSHHEIIRN